MRTGYGDGNDWVDGGPLPRPPVGMTNDAYGERVLGRRHTDLEPIDRLIGRLATDTGGVVALRDLRAAGITYSAVSHRVRRGKLFEVAPRVYAVGHYARTPASVWWTAILCAGGGDARLGGRSGVEAQGWISPDLREVRVVGERCSPRSVLASWPDGLGDTWISIGRTKLAESTSVLASHGVPTLPASALMLELAAHPDTSDRLLQAALRQAEFDRRIDDASLRGALGPGRPGSSRIREILDKRVIGMTVSRSALEEAARDLWRRMRLPVPATNVDVPSRAQRVMNGDFYWAQWRLVIETDGAQHATPAAFQRDRDYDARLRAMGITVLRFTADQILNQPELVEEAVRSYLTSIGVQVDDRY